MKNARPDVSLNVSDSLAPITLLKVQIALSSIEEGQLLEVICADEQTRLDLSDIVKNSGHKVVSLDETDSRFRFLIRKTIAVSKGC